MKSLLLLVNWTAMIMVIVLGATSVHAEQPMHLHGDSVDLVAVERFVAIEAHTSENDIQIEPTFHCGAAILGIESPTSLERRFGSLPFVPVLETPLTLRSIPLDPRPPRA